LPGYSMKPTDWGGQLATETEFPYEIRSPCQGRGQSLDSTHEADV
jgi:hypothetical protein